MNYTCESLSELNSQSIDINFIIKQLNEKFDDITKDDFDEFKIIFDKLN